MTTTRHYHYSLSLVYDDAHRYMTAGGVRMLLHRVPTVPGIDGYGEIVFQPYAGSARVRRDGHWFMLTDAEQYAIECYLRRWAHRCREGADARAGRDRRMQCIPWSGPGPDRRQGERRVAP